MIKIISGDLLEAPQKFILHQTNCLSTSASGLANLLFQKYPYADTYTTRTSPNKMGTIEILGNGIDQRFIINAYAQYYPGAARRFGIDTTKDRQDSFWKCLLEVSKIKDLESIAFPYLIGCGLARGNWEHYLRMLTEFSNLDLVKGVEVILYKKD